MYLYMQICVPIFTHTHTYIYICIYVHLRVDIMHSLGWFPSGPFSNQPIAKWKPTKYPKDPGKCIVDIWAMTLGPMYVLYGMVYHTEDWKP